MPTRLKAAGNYRLETGIPDQLLRHSQRLFIVTGQRYGQSGFVAMRLLREGAIAHGIERAHDAGIGQKLPGSNTRALFQRLVGHGTVAAGKRVAGIQHDPAGQRLGIILTDLRHGAVGYGQQDDIAESDRLADGAGMGIRADTIGHRYEFLWMPGGKHHFMTGIGQQLANGTAEITGTDCADLHGIVCLWCVLFGRGEWPEHHEQRQQQDSGQASQHHVLLTALIE